MTAATSDRTTELREQFAEADAISRLEGYDPDAYEQEQKERIARGEITTEQFIALMAQHVINAETPAEP